MTAVRNIGALLSILEAYLPSFMFLLIRGTGRLRPARLVIDWNFAFVSFFPPFFFDLVFVFFFFADILVDNGELRVDDARRDDLRFQR